MRFRLVLSLLWICAGIPLPAQDQAPVPQPPAADAPAPPPVLINSGKPMVLPFQCTTEDVQSAGFSCSEDVPCPIYLELSTATAAGSRYYVTGNIHSDAVTLYGILLASGDSGATWQEVNPRIRGAGIDHLQFLDTDTGWAGGEQLFPIPQEPFVLLTTDAGKSWRKQPIFGEEADNHFGSMQAMYFTSKTDGGVIIDRSQGGDPGPFALYESPDGGVSWSIKEQTAKPIKLKGAAAPDTDWRVRVDPVTKAFRVERRQGEQWSSRASFAVNLGMCKLAPPQ